MQATVEKAIPAKNPAMRQVLVNIGNRYVVFGTNNILPGQRVLGPGDVTHHFSSRVADEYEFPHDRLINSIQVDGAEVNKNDLSLEYGWDVELNFPDGTKTFVEIKVRTRKFSRRDMERHLAWIRTAQVEKGCTVEVWNFNIERLNLTIMSVDNEGMPSFSDLEPLNVWEFNEDGSVFDRARVMSRIEDWETRIAKIYEDVKKWTEEFGVEIDTSRTVQMSEELMQKYAAPDRDLPILDISRDGKSILSLVPVGLWIFGSNGRIDIITQRGTLILIDAAASLTPSKWKILIDRSARSFEDWNRETFVQLLNKAEAS